jgi:hypothetical protein
VIFIELCPHSIRQLRDNLPGSAQTLPNLPQREVATAEAAFFQCISIVSAIGLPALS